MKFEENYSFFVNGESKTKENLDTWFNYKGYFYKNDPKNFIILELEKPKKDKITELLKEVDKHQKQNGREEGVEFPFDAVLTPTKDYIEIRDHAGIPIIVKLEKQLEKKEQKVIEDWNRESDSTYWQRYGDILSGNIKRQDSFTIGKKEGIKESKTVEKAPIFTYCKQMKNAMEALALRSLYGHIKYEKGDDWENFSRVENGEFEYANAQFRHALGIGEDDEKDHLIANAWNAVSLLEIYLRKKLK